LEERSLAEANGGEKRVEKKKHYQLQKRGGGGGGGGGGWEGGWGGGGFLFSPRPSRSTHPTKKKGNLSRRTRTWRVAFVVEAQKKEWRISGRKESDPLNLLQILGRTSSRARPRVLFQGSPFTQKKAPAEPPMPWKGAGRG